ncbi:glyoxalase superfamily protein [Martelella mangrovi]|uniref:Glyoxalase-related protein domain-containing protein n=1 Tax=Martelella mangrovi TaxID=1397477 RepID=A0ABV2I613_9HYPH
MPHLSNAPLPSLEAVKDQAKRLRAHLDREGEAITHSRALELIAAQYGFRDWNTLHARIGNRPPLNPWLLGSRVSGTYLGHAFNAEIISVKAFSNKPGHYRLTLKFDDAVDVVTFDSFSAFRRRINCTVDETGRSPAKTSDGRPHVELAW